MRKVVFKIILFFTVLISFNSCYYSRIHSFEKFDYAWADYLTEKRKYWTVANESDTIMLYNVKISDTSLVGDIADTVFFEHKSEKSDYLLKKGGYASRVVHLNGSGNLVGDLFEIQFESISSFSFHTTNSNKTFGLYFGSISPLVLTLISIGVYYETKD